MMVGGEERATWLCPFGLASKESFAFSMRLSRGGEGIGRVSLDRNKPLNASCGLGLLPFSKALRDRQAMKIPSFALDAWLRVEWL